MYKRQYYHCVVLCVLTPLILNDYGMVECFHCIQNVVYHGVVQGLRVNVARFSMDVLMNESINE